MGTCTTPTPLGQYGGNTYGEGTSPCTTSTPAGYGDGVGPCAPSTAGDPCLVGTIMRMATSIWVGHRTKQYGDDTFQAATYPECKRLVQACVPFELSERRVEEPGKPLVVYLRLPKALCP